MKFAKYLADNEKYRFETVYPEGLFEEILYGSNKNNLLDLETLLAESVDAIIIFLESAGSLAELGAFTQDKNLIKKLICVMDVSIKRIKVLLIKAPYT